MNKLDECEKDQVHVISTYMPYSYKDVEQAFILCNKSFDKTVKYLELSTAFNRNPESTASFGDWLDGCGFRFFHNTDRYGFYGHGHVFVATHQCEPDEIESLLSGLEGSDADAETSAGCLQKKEKEESIYIGHDADPFIAFLKVLGKLQGIKGSLDYGSANNR